MLIQNWTEFENYVAMLYESLGYDVEHDININGNQIDLFAKKYVHGVGWLKIAIECKFTETGESISNNKIQQFLNFAENARNSGFITNAVFIVNSKYTRFAKEVINNSSALSLLTLKQLENQLVNLTDEYMKYIYQYEKNRIFHNYVSLSGTSSVPLTVDTSSHLKSVEQSIVNWVENEGSGFVTILGDFGAGKTTLLEKIKYIYAKKYIVKKTEINPIIVHLKEYYKHSNIESFMIATLKREFGREIPFEMFWRIANEGKFLFLMDGFDEMVPIATLENKAKQLATLTSLFSLNSKLLLTCRPAYFINRNDYFSAIDILNKANLPVETTDKYSSKFIKMKGDALQEITTSHLYAIFAGKPEYKHLVKIDPITIELDTFSEEQINQFLQKKNEKFLETSNGKANWETIKLFLDEIYDLSDLMKRPILLDMITETVVCGALDISDHDRKLGPTSLYEIYTNMQFERDWNKGESRQKCLTKQQRREFSQLIAVIMLKKGKLEVNYSEILELIEDKKNYKFESLNTALTEIPQEAVAADIQLCTFLTRKEDGRFGFTHKSFMEYFVARHIKEGFTNPTKKDLLLLECLPREVLYYLGGYGYEDPQLTDKFVHILGLYAFQNEVEYRRNIACAILYSSSKLKSINLKKIQFREIDIINKELENSKIENSKFERIKSNSLKIIGSELYDIVFQDCEMKELEFNNVSGQLIFQNCDTKNVLFEKSVFEIATRSSDFTNLSISYGKMFLTGRINFKNIVFLCTCLDLNKANGVIDSGRIENSNIEINGSNLQFNNIYFNQNSLYFSDGNQLSKCKIIDCNIDFNHDGAQRIAIDDVYFDNSSLNVICHKNDSLFQIVASKVEFVNCVLLGVPITQNEYDNTLDESKGRVIEKKYINCRGFLFYDSLQKKNIIGGKTLKNPIEKISGDLFIVHRPSFYEKAEIKEQVIQLIEKYKKGASQKYISKIWS